MAAKKTAAKKAPAKNSAAIQDKYTKTQILNTISENTGLTRKEVSSVLNELDSLIERLNVELFCSCEVFNGVETKRRTLDRTGCFGFSAQ
jgi:hypothetical protein